MSVILSVCLSVPGSLARVASPQTSVPSPFLFPPELSWWAGIACRVGVRTHSLRMLPSSQLAAPRKEAPGRCSLSAAPQRVSLSTLQSQREASARLSSQLESSKALYGQHRESRRGWLESGGVPLWSTQPRCPSRERLGTPRCLGAGKTHPPHHSVHDVRYQQKRTMYHPCPGGEVPYHCAWE